MTLAIPFSLYGSPTAAQRLGVYFYRNAAEKLRRYTLGAYPSMSLAEARTEWRKAREAVAAGRDPAKDKKRETGATEFSAVLAEWLKRDQGGEQDRRTR